MDRDLASYIGAYLREMYPLFKWRVVKNMKKHLVEVYFTFQVEVDETIRVQDVLGQVNDEGVIQFEDVVCFYDPRYSHVQPQNYLQAVPLNSEAGLEKGFVDAFLKQLNIVIIEGTSMLKEFIQHASSESFELHWNERNVKGTIQTMKSTGRYNEEKIYMDLNGEESLIKQLTKDEQYDGVERV